MLKKLALLHFFIKIGNEFFFPSFDDENNSSYSKSVFGDFVRSVKHISGVDVLKDLRYLVLVQQTRAIPVSFIIMKIL
jgi:hypothetical protein